MKHLQSYKLFESVSDIRNEIEDILTEIYHLGFEISIYNTTHSHFNEIKVFIEKPNDDLVSYLSSSDNYKPTQEFVDSLQHLISWADENNFVYSIESKKNGVLFKQYKSAEDIESITQDEIDYITIIFRLSKNLSESNDFKNEDLIIESALNESIIYFSPRMRDHLNQVNNNISKRLLDLEGTDISNVDVTFIDSDKDGNVTFITMSNAMKMIKAKYPEATNADLDLSGDKDIADIVFKNDMYALSNGLSNGGTGVYIKSRNTIKIGKLVNKIFKGTLSNSEVEKFVNDFKASTPSAQEKIELVSGDAIRYWYNKENYKEVIGSLGNSCMAGKDGNFFNLYAENPNSCNLLIMTVGDKLVARALVWKLNSIKIDKYESDDDGIDENNKPEYFLDRVYSIEDYQVEKMRKFALDKNWAIRKWNSGHQYERIYWKDNNKSYSVSMSVKVNKSKYGDTFPYMDTFKRYDHFNGLLWNDENRRKGGHILQSTQGGYQESIPKRQVYINKFKDFFKKG